MKQLYYFYIDSSFGGGIVLRDPDNKNDDISAKTKEEALKKARIYYNVSRIKLSRIY